MTRWVATGTRAGSCYSLSDTEPNSPGGKPGASRTSDRVSARPPSLEGLKPLLRWNRTSVPRPEGRGHYPGRSDPLGAVRLWPREPSERFWELRVHTPWETSNVS